MQQLFTVLPFCSFFPNLACHLRELWTEIEFLSERMTPKDDKMIEHIYKLVEDSNETLFYIQDLFEVTKRKNPVLFKMLVNSLLNYAYLPGVVQSLCVLKRKP